MYIALINKLEGFSCYGDIPTIPLTKDDRFELFKLTSDDRELLLPFVYGINDTCGTALDFGDIDYFDKDGCVLLRSFIHDISHESLNERQKELFSVLDDYATKACNLGTGIVLEL